MSGGAPKAGEAGMMSAVDFAHANKLIVAMPPVLPCMHPDCNTDCQAAVAAIKARDAQHAALQETAVGLLRDIRQHRGFDCRHSDAYLKSIGLEKCGTCVWCRSSAYLASLKTEGTPR